jgi:ATP synthase F1 epsilon subunit
MAEGLKIEIVSPERLVLSEVVTSVTVPGTEGYFTVMFDHAPFMTTLRLGFITVTGLDGKAHVYFVRGGFADVSTEGLTILAEEASPFHEFDSRRSAGRDQGGRGRTRPRPDAGRQVLCAGAGQRVAEPGHRSRPDQRHPYPLGFRPFRQFAAASPEAAVFVSACAGFAQNIGKALICIEIWAYLNRH